jgi:hypothetical protein
MQTLLASRTQRNTPAVQQQALDLFRQLLALQGTPSPRAPAHRRPFYHRVWFPLIVLWYLIWQRLQPKPALEKVIIDARRGGADALESSGRKPWSQRIVSNATTAYSKARQRLPLAWVQQCFATLAGELTKLVAPPNPAALPLILWDGSTLRLRPHRDIAQEFPPHRTRRKKSYWCVARVVVGFCAHSGVALAAQMSGLQASEQALAVRQILGWGSAALHLGDRNFGVWRVVRAAVQSRGHALVRLTRVRAGALSAGRPLKPGLDLPVQWSPTRHDQVDRGLNKEAVSGRLVVVPVRRRGFRPQKLFLFTTLLDAQLYPPTALAALYAVRWEVELNFRTVKVTMGLAQLEVKSAAMAQKEFYAGLMAYNLVRGLMGLAAQQAGCTPQRISFASAQTQLVATLAIVFRSWIPECQRQAEWDLLLREVSRALLPKRKKPRPSEPRQQNYPPRVFPVLQCSRKQARQQLKKQQMKSSCH